MGAMQRHRLKRQLENIDLSILGDAETTQLATGTVAELLKTAGAIAAADQAKKEAAKKTADEKKAYDEAHKEENDAIALAKESRKQATLAAADALAEKDPKGPKHLKAKIADDNAKVAEAKAAYFSTGSAGAGAGAGAVDYSRTHAAPSTGVPTWLWVTGGAVGVGVLGLITWKLLSGRK